jgi:hypothetical protein
MNLAPIIFATLVISAFAAMPLKPDDALTGLLDEEPATKEVPNFAKGTKGASLIDAFLDTKEDYSTEILATEGILTAPMQIEGDYIVVPNGNGNDMTGGLGGEAAFTVRAATDTTVELQSQVFGETGADNSFWIWFDGASTADKCPSSEAIVSCTSLKYEWGTAQYQPSAGWQWGYIGWGTDQPIRFPLSAGDHTLHVGQREDGSKMHALRITSGDAVFIPPTSASYTAVATWPIAHWGSWPSSAGSQASCVAASATAFTNPVDVSSESHNEGKNTMFIQCCSTSGAGSTRDCGSTEGKSWSEAKSFCEGKSERLCTASELLLTWSKGCYVDGVDSRAWSSDSC